MLNISPEQLLYPVNFKTPSVKLKSPSKNKPYRNLSHNKDYVQELIKSIPCEEDCSTITSLPNGTEINKYQEKIENLTTALTALQLYVKEQFSIIRKQLEDVANTDEPTNWKSISSLQEEIDYLWEENYAKTQIIKQLTDTKVVPSSSDITAGACSCKIASAHTYHVDNNYKEPSIDSETNTN